jgi:hypothetical protein
MSRYLPIVLGVLAIVGLTIPQIVMSDRFASTNVSAEQRAELLKKVPKKIGDWIGEDSKPNETVRQVAGAVGAVEREYRNIRTNEKVNLWLIVGHSRNVSRHSPNTCYPAAGFEQRAPENSLYPMEFPGVPKAPFWTNTFFKEDVSGRRLVRVFWSWYNPQSAEHEGRVVWEAPENSVRQFGNTRALYKMYLTSDMRDTSETAEQSACLRFAREFMPIVNKALADVHSEIHTAETASDEVAAAAPNTDEVAEGAATDLFNEAGDNATTATSGATEGQTAPAP